MLRVSNTHRRTAGWSRGVELCSCRGKYHSHLSDNESFNLCWVCRVISLHFGLLHKRETLKGSRAQAQHYALVIREACGRIIIISADQKITNNNGHQRGRTRATCLCRAAWSRTITGRIRLKRWIQEQRLKKWNTFSLQPGQSPSSVEEIWIFRKQNKKKGHVSLKLTFGWCD